MLEEVTQEAYRIAELVEQADSRAASRSATEEAEELRAGASPIRSLSDHDVPQLVPSANAVPPVKLCHHATPGGLLDCHGGEACICGTLHCACT